jgi:hypothetical protein
VFDSKYFVIVHPRFVDFIEVSLILRNGNAEMFVREVKKHDFSIYIFKNNLHYFHLYVWIFYISCSRQRRHP